MTFIVFTWICKFANNLMKICCEPIELTWSQLMPRSSYAVCGIAPHRVRASTYVHLNKLRSARAGLWIPSKRGSEGALASLLERRVAAL